MNESSSHSALDRGILRLPPLPRADRPLVLLPVLALVAAFLFGTLPRGQDWSGDAALYIMNARNVVLSSSPATGLPCSFYSRTAGSTCTASRPLHQTHREPGSS